MPTRTGSYYGQGPEFAEQLKGALRLDGADGTRGTPLHGTKLPVAVWLNAVELFALSRNVRIADVCRACHVSHKTAWRIRSLLREMCIVVVEHHERRSSRQANRPSPSEPTA